MKDKIFKIIIGAFKRKLIVSDMVEMNLIAKGIDELTKAHYMPVIEKQEELIKALSQMIDWDNYPNDRLDEYYELLSELSALESETEPAKEHSVKEIIVQESKKSRKEFDRAYMNSPEPAKELYEKDIPSECRECGFQNTENCNTCKVINTQYDGC